MINPKIGVLIPTRNRAHMLPDAIESALAQDYTNLEVVVSDNASTDETASVAARYAGDKRFRYFRNETDLGGHGNWRKLLYEYASGDYAQLLADDDVIIDPQYLSRVAALIRESDVKAVFSDFVYDDTVAKTRYAPRVGMPRVVTPGLWAEALGTRRNGARVFPCLATVCHVELARALKVYHPAVPGLDFELILRFMMAAPTGYLDGHYCMARVHQENASRTADRVESFLEGGKMFLRFYEQGCRAGLPERTLRLARRRLLAEYLRVFVVRAWLDGRGASGMSFNALFRKMASLDAFAAVMTPLHGPTLAKLLLPRNSRPYRWARRFNVFLQRRTGRLSDIENPTSG